MTFCALTFVVSSFVCSINVTVVVSGQQSLPFYFNFDAPIITSVLPIGIPTKSKPWSYHA